MPTLGIVLDANILFSAPLRDTLLRAADAGLFRVHWTDGILEEARRNLVATGRASEEQAQRLIATLEAYFPEAAVTGSCPVVPGMPNHPKDRHVLAAALVSKSQIIVTHNLRDLPAAALSRFDIRAQSPDQFLSDLFDAAPDMMARVVIDRAADLHNPPQTVDLDLDRLAQHTPNFASLVRDHLQD